MAANGKNVISIILAGQKPLQCWRGTSKKMENGHSLSPSCPDGNDSRLPPNYLLELSISVWIINCGAKSPSNLIKASLHWHFATEKRYGPESSAAQLIVYRLDVILLANYKVVNKIKLRIYVITVGTSHFITVLLFARLFLPCCRVTTTNRLVYYTPPQFDIWMCRRKSIGSASTWKNGLLIRFAAIY